jgi:hypothetical protein
VVTGNPAFGIGESPHRQGHASRHRQAGVDHIEVERSLSLELLGSGGKCRAVEPKAIPI